VSSLRPVTFLSDYGRDDDFVGVCHAVMLKLVPDLRLIDITHGLPRHRVRPAALVLRNTLPYTPAGVHLSVVDPGVGTERRPVAIRLVEEERILIGPDNGVLSLAAELFGGAAEAVDLTLSPFRLEPLSATFHGRDIFSPVAARLAEGVTLPEAGEPIEPDDLNRLELPRPEIGADRVTGHALYVDRFGNIALNITQADLEGTGIKVGQALEIKSRDERFHGSFARTFADVRHGEILLYEDSYWTLALAINRGNASRTMRLEPDDAVTITPLQ
jgi:S-adenosyl-L-methionine hydrolase (adenosine-forming)